jgi:hypothetical protein
MQEFIKMAKVRYTRNGFAAIWINRGYPIGLGV